MPKLKKFIENKDGMYWFQHKSFFRIIHKQFQGMKKGVGKILNELYINGLAISRTNEVLLWYFCMIL